MIFSINDYEIYISVIALLVSIFVYVNQKKTRKLSEKTYQMALSTKHINEIEFLKMIPSLDLLGVVAVDGVDRIIVLISNMRSTPFRVHAVKVKIHSPKPRNLRNLVRSKIESDFDWDYESFNDYHWNPKGNLDYGEKYQSEAAEFLTVKDQEKILITIPNFSEYKKYRLLIETSHGNVSITGRVSRNGKVHFCNDFRQSFS